jgi:hypothetical protein
MSGRRYWLWVLAEILVGMALIINAMDLGADSWPTLRNEAYPMRSTEAWRWQFLLLALFGMWLAARAPTVIRALRRTPVPRTPLTVLSVVVAVQLVHVAFHVEVFPFSHVGMFSFVEPAPTPEWWSDGWHVRDERGERQPFSYFRLGDPWLASPVALDGRTSWIFFEHRGGAVVRERLARELAEVGLVGPPVHERWLVRMSDGQVLEIWDPQRQASTP